MRVSEGDKFEVRPSEGVGWVPGFCTYSATTGNHWIIDTEKHGRFSFSGPHPDLRPIKPEKK